MAKTITLRIDDEIYELFNKAAAGSRRPISNFIEYATLNYLIQDMNISDKEMEEILQDKNLIKSLNKGRNDVKKRKYRFV